jgi:dTDP-4-dehydrorhamnose reductase
VSAGRPVVPLVLGAGGMLGSAVARALERAHPATISATRAEIDVTDRFRLEAEVERLQPTVIVNCAAYTDVDGCETDRDRARRVNADGAGSVALAAAGAGCRLIHVSTDFVFDGGAGRPYTEEDTPAPASEYGRSKLEGEKRIASIHPDHVIIRTAWLYGRGRANFVDTIRSRAIEGGVLRVVTDQTGSPTWVVDLSEAIVLLLGTEHRGIVHFAGAGACTRFELAGAIVSILGAARARLQPIGTDEAGRIAVRPKDSALDTSLYERLTGWPPRPWQVALREYLSAGAARSADA